MYKYITVVLIIALFFGWIVSCHNDGFEDDNPVNPDLTLPEQPTQLRTKDKGAEYISLVWKDNSAFEDGFLIEYRQANENDIWSIEGLVAENDTVLLCDSLTPNTTYNFRVCSFITENDSNMYNGFSNELTEKTNSHNPSESDILGNLNIINETGEMLVLHVDNVFSKIVPSSSDAFKVKVETIDTVFLDIYKYNLVESNIYSPTVPAYISTRTILRDEEEQFWLIPRYDEDNSPEYGLLYLRYTTDTEYGVNVLKGSRNGSIIATLIPTSDDKQVMLPYGTHTLIYRYYNITNPGDVIYVENEDEEGEPILIILNDSTPIQTRVIPSQPDPILFYGSISIKNSCTYPITIFANGTYIEHIIYTEGSPLGLSNIDRGITTRYTLLASDNIYILQAKHISDNTLIAQRDYAIQVDDDYYWEITDTSPARPEDFTCYAYSSNEVQLSWNPGSNDVEGYRIERSQGDDNWLVIVEGLDYGDTLYDDSGLETNTTYQYKMFATKTVGNESSATPIKEISLLGRPQNLTAEVLSDDSVALHWEDGSELEAGFRLERYQYGLNWTIIAQFDQTSYVDTGLSAGTSYTYRVQAYHDDGVSSYSQPVEILTNQSPPDSPYNLVLTQINATSIQLNWEDVVGENNYHIQRKIEGEEYVSVHSVSEDETTFLDESLEPNLLYYYRIIASNNNGNSDPSNEASIFLNNDPPSAVFEVNLEQGNLNTTFYVDASGCEDDWDTSELLEIRWEWDTDQGFTSWTPINNSINSTTSKPNKVVNHKNQNKHSLNILSGITQNRTILNFTDWTTDKTAEHNYSDPGEKFITLEVRDLNGNIGSTSRIVTVAENEPPEAQLTVSPSIGYYRNTEFYGDAASTRDDLDSLNHLEFSWNWDDGNGFSAFSSSPNSSCTYDEPGEKNVILRAQDTYGEIDIDEVTIYAAENHAPDVIINLIPSDSAHFRTLFSIDVSETEDEDIIDDLMFRYKWTGDGVFSEWNNFTNFNHTYDSEYIGLQTVTVEARDTENEIGEGIIHIYVQENTPPTFNLIIDPIANHYRGEFVFNASELNDDMDSVEDLRFRWRFDEEFEFIEGGNNPTISYSFETIDYVGEHIVTAECIDLDNDTSRVSSVITANRNHPPESNFTVTPNDTAHINTYFMFNASLTTDDFDLTEELSYSWQWNQRDEFTEPNPDSMIVEHKFIEPGIKAVTLESYDLDGDVGRVSTLVIVSPNFPPNPFIEIEPIEGDINTIFTLNASNTTDDFDTVGVLLFRWNWDDGNGFSEWSTEVNSECQYENILENYGTHTIILEVQDSNGEIEVETQEIEIPENEPPDARFVVTPEEGHIRTVFTVDASESSDPETDFENLLFSWRWETGGEFTDESNSPVDSHFYETHGFKVITLRVRDEHDNTDDFIATVEVFENQPPEPEFTITPENGNIRTTYSFDASGTTDDIDPLDSLDFSWQFDTDLEFTEWLNNPRIDYNDYNTGGNKEITLQVRDTDNDVNTVTQILNVANNQNPVANLVVNPDTGNIVTLFRASASGSSDNEDELEWLDFRIRWHQDENFSIWSPDTIFTHSYTNFLNQGDQNVEITLEVRDRDGAVDDFSVEALVLDNHAPNAIFHVTPSDTGRLNTIFVFDASATTDDIENTNMLDFRWRVEDTEDFTNWSPAYIEYNHIYTIAGIKTVELQVRDSYEAVGNYEIDIFVNENIPPTACLSLDPIPEELGQVFTADGSCSNDDMDELEEMQYQIRWEEHLNFTDWSNSYDFQYVYETPGNKVITFRVMDTYNTIDDTVLILNIAPNRPPGGNLRIEPLSGGLETQFMFEVINLYDDLDDPQNLLIRWKNDDSEVFTDWQTSNKHESYYKSKGKKNVSVEIMDSYGSKTIINKEIVIE